LTNFRGDLRPIEVIVSKVKMLEMGKFEEGAVGREGAIEAAAAEIKPNDTACVVVATNTLP